MRKSPAQLDHVVLLLPHQDLVKLPKWLTDRFTVSAGGKHADGKTENRLILFRDGTYVELIAFIKDDPDKRKGHRWDKDFGVVDYALTTRIDFDLAGLQERLKQCGSGISYAEPVEGGRVTPDKKELKWKVTIPQGIAHGTVPFWCHDLTPRERRVPAFDGNTHHPCGAVGMANVIAHIHEEHFDRVVSALPAITNLSRNEEAEYTVSTPYEIGKPDEPKLRLRKRGEDQKQDLRLTLEVQCPGRGGQGNIEQRVGDGVVLINFVNGEHHHVRGKEVNGK
ncbi:hypothetical protein LTR36_008027 [Oleoguttula mirabilis]|uniref:Glyoxalase-like domain-containing protein n=1 Tax=Oleoguttula mirabilis TaxID=1507867 RepID=A0AAV9J9I2_9PEZI|nr:hypothetical protein LTR36_008027 [Oleoguttula mirabilis]